MVNPLAFIFCCYCTECFCYCLHVLFFFVFFAILEIVVYLLAIKSKTKFFAGALKESLIVLTDSLKEID